jgi:pimeloyl-ACP methyl ester carboxylesterase
MYKFPPKQKAQVLGETVEYVTAGTGPATVVLVNGSGGPIEGWHKVFGPISGFSRVFAYNRAGIGGSSRPAVPQVGTHMVASLRAVLHAAGVQPPYVLVGHSLGGLIVNLFARLHPSEVSTAILLEATAVEDIAALARYESYLQRLARVVLEKLLPSASNAESRHAVSTALELQAAPNFPPIPLVVVTGGKPAMAWATAAEALAARAKHQHEMLAMSPFGRQVIAAGSGHFPQFSEPELVVREVEKASGSGLHS